MKTRLRVKGQCSRLGMNDDKTHRICHFLKASKRKEEEGAAAAVVAVVCVLPLPSKGMKKILPRDMQQ